MAVYSIVCKDTNRDGYVIEFEEPSLVEVTSLNLDAVKKIVKQLYLGTCAIKELASGEYELKWDNQLTRVMQFSRRDVVKG